MFEKFVDFINDTDLDDEKKKEFYNVLIEAYEGFDCDIIYECSGLDTLLDEVLNEYYGLDSDK